MDETRPDDDQTRRLSQGIEQHNAGDPLARGELLNIACDRLMQLTERLRTSLQQLDDRRSTDEVFQHASWRLYQALHDTPIKDVRDFYQVAAREIRRELIGLCRPCSAEHEPADLETSRADAAAEELRQWARFHDSVDALPEQQREVFDLIWYHELPRHTVVELLGISEVEVRRLWRAARLGLHPYLASIHDDKAQ